VNIVLLGKELFQGIASPMCFIITLSATLTYTVLALRLASNVFGSDTVLFGSNASIGGLSKRPSKASNQVPMKLGLGYLAVLVPGFIVLAGLRGRLVAPENLPGQLVLSGIMTIGLFALLPVLLTSWKRIRFAEAFAIRSFSPLALVGAVLLGGTLWALTYEALLLGKGASGWTQLLSNPKLQELAKRLTSETPLLLRLLTLAVIPAICEELFFRGFLMNALCKTSAQWKSALFISTFLFAAFHVIVDVSLTLERFPATFLLGLALGWIRITSRSVLPGMAMHVVSNGLLLSLSNLQPMLQKLGLDLAVKNETHLPAGFLAGASVVALLGVFLVWKSSSSRKTNLASE
jgi:ABC-2 type transport system permease protein/sodium transport system permease protein